MLRTTGELKSVDKANTINRVGGNSEVGRVKSKNMIIPESLAKSKSLVKPSFRMGFLTSRARLAFIKLKQVFIKALILYHFDWNINIRSKLI